MTPNFVEGTRIAKRESFVQKQQIIVQGGSPGLVVKGGDSYMRALEFESRFKMDNLSHYLSQFFNDVLKYRKGLRKGMNGPSTKKYFSDFFSKTLIQNGPYFQCSKKESQ